MKPQAVDGMITRRGKRGRAAFSLAELMIALAILGMGLLVIGASLPVGAQYTRDSANMAMGEACVDYAQDIVEQSLNLPNMVLDSIGALDHEPGLFMPRRDVAGQGQVVDANGDSIDYGDTPVAGWYEPVIKVRPLPMQNIDLTPGSSTYGQQIPANFPAHRVAERAVGRWGEVMSLFPITKAEEVDQFAGSLPWIRPSIACVSSVYPPITLDQSFSVSDFMDYGPAGKYRASPALNRITGNSEVNKVCERKITWTAFYRRVSYAAGSDPSLYEIITVAVRKQSKDHRFPVQDGGYAPNGGDVAYSFTDSATPIPWLVCFSSLPLANFDDGYPQGSEPATLTFWFNDSVPGSVLMDGLFPVGTIFFPARNDDEPDLISNVEERVGFGPLAPTALPYYEVVARPPNSNEVVVKFNGYYPRQGDGNGSETQPNDAGVWPVWVIPPAFKDVDGYGNPVFPDESPILAVRSRFVRLPMIP